MILIRSTRQQLFRAYRVARSPCVRRTFATEASVNGSSSTASQSILGGLVGGSLVFLASYGWYRSSGAKTALDSVRQAKGYLDQATQQIQEKAPEPNEAVRWLRQTAHSYAGFIPGAQSYVDAALGDLDAVYDKHGAEVDRIVKEAYEELQEISKKEGASLKAAYDTWGVLEKRIREIGGLAGDAAEQILDNHPQLKQQLGGNIDQLREMGKRYGRQAQEQVDKTWEQIRSIVSKGISADSINEIKKVIQEKKEVLNKFGEEAYQKSMEQAKPYLDKAPQVKELVEKNADALKQSDVTNLVQQIKQAVDSGNTEQLESFVKNAADQINSSGESTMDLGGIESYLHILPHGDQIVPTLQKLVKIGQMHGKETEDLLKSTISEINELLQERMQDAEKIAQKVAEKAPNQDGK